ncbi:MAG TPA: hypothetical protein VNZ62_03570 [Capillimicrobium sp.]|jgi:hypothetical protein|nr:hypothetical protein [Capillimicrobium sp.]
METDRATEPAESPVPGVIPAAPHVETEHDAGVPQPDALDDTERTPNASGSADQQGPVRALLARLLRKER